MEYQGIAAAPGYACGPALLWEDQQIPVTQQVLPAEETSAEVERFAEEVWQAIREISEIQESTRQKIGDKQAEIFSAHVLILEDPEYIGSITAKIQSEKYNAAAAVQEVTDQFLALFAGMDNAYLRERAADLRDVSRRLLRRLTGIQAKSAADLAGKAILIAHDLTPSDTAQLDRSKIAGFVTETGGRTSHSAIMARSLEIPAVVGLAKLGEKIKSGDFLIVDGNAGKILVNPPEDLIQIYQDKQAKLAASRSKLEKLIHKPSITGDGIRVELAANIGNLADAQSAVANGAEGIGLYRTEFLYLGRTELPSETEQYAAYKEVAELLGQDRPVVIRTLDIGGDKELPYLHFPKEMNPFLGYRAIRLCLDRSEIFTTQLRAILRASAFGNIKLMYPMIATLQELRAANQILEIVKAGLCREGIPFNEAMEVGIMVEIPAAAVLADQFALEVDFFSIGTNDLVQYTMAADRLNEKVSYLYQPFNPAVLRLIQVVITTAHQAGKWVGICGEMAGDLTAIPILLGMGLDEFSMSASAILPARSLVSRLSQKEARRVAQAVLAMDNAQAIQDFVNQELPKIAQASDE